MRTDAWLDADEQRAWRTLIGTTTSLLGALENELQAEHGLSLGEYEVLAMLSEADDQRMRMAELATRLHMSPSGLTRRLDRLVRSGLVRRDPCPQDRRVAYAALTPDGLERLEIAAPTHVRGVREHFVDRLSAAQLAALAAALEQVDVDPNLAAGGCDEAATA